MASDAETDVLKLSIYGDILFKPRTYRYMDRNAKPLLVFNDFEITPDGDNSFAITCPGRTPKRRIATFTGTYAEASKALKLQLVTARLTK